MSNESPAPTEPTSNLAAAIGRHAVWLPVIAGAWMIVQVLAIWAGRLTYPFDTEWMEGGVLVHAWRLQHLQPIYVEPSVDFIPMIYPPGYPGLLAFLGLFVGISHPLGRFVSVLATLASAGAMVHASRRHLGTWTWGFIGAATWLGLYMRSGAFYDMVRPDALHVALLTWSIVLALEGNDKAVQRSGLLLFLSFVVKHNAAAYGPALALGILLRSGLGPALRFTAWAAVPGLLFTLVMQMWSGGLFTVWLLDVPRSHPFVEDRYLPGTLRELGHTLPIACGVLTAWLLSLGPRYAARLPIPVLTLAPIAAGAIAIAVLGAMPPVNGIERPATWEAWSVYALTGVSIAMLPLMVLGMVMDRKVHGEVMFGALIMMTAWQTSALMRGHHGGFINVFIFLHWSMAAMCVVALADIARRMPSPAGPVLAAGVATAQLGLLLSRFEAERLLPDTSDVAAGHAMVDYLKDQEGPVLSPFNPWLAQQAGHEPGWHLIAMWDIRHPNGPFQEHAQKILRQISEGYYGVIVDSDDGAQLGYNRAYEKVKTLQTDRSALMPKTGWRARPNIIWKRKGEAE